MAARALLQVATLAVLGAFYAVTAWVALHPRVSPLYRDHFVRPATADWRIQRVDASVADGVDFTTDIYPREVDYVLGLDWIEPDGRWSDARRWPTISVLLRQPVAGEQCLQLRFRATPSQVGAPVSIRVGRAAATLIPRDAERHDYSLSLLVPQPASSIDIEPSRPSRPRQWGRSADLRRLGIKLSWLRLRPAACQPG